MKKMMAMMMVLALAGVCVAQTAQWQTPTAVESKVVTATIPADKFAALLALAAQNGLALPAGKTAADVRMVTLVSTGTAVRVNVTWK